MGHVVLLGDSIFDNARYVPDRPSVIEQVRRSLPGDWSASLLAVDGHTIEDISRQLPRMPAGATHLFVSVGGNDVLGESAILGEPAASVADALALLAKSQAQFRVLYRAMLQTLSVLEKPTTVCTVYDSMPGFAQADLTALALFNEVILREAFLAGLPVIDLRLVCNQAADYSPLSPIEPSCIGGAKIARAVAQVATQHDFSRRQTIVY